MQAIIRNNTYLTKPVPHSLKKSEKTQIALTSDKAIKQQPSFTGATSLIKNAMGYLRFGNEILPELPKYFKGHKQVALINGIQKFILKDVPYSKISDSIKLLRRIKGETVFINASLFHKTKTIEDEYIVSLMTLKRRGKELGTVCYKREIGNPTTYIEFVDSTGGRKDYKHIANTLLQAVFEKETERGVLPIIQGSPAQFSQQIKFAPARLYKSLGANINGGFAQVSKENSKQILEQIKQKGNFILKDTGKNLEKL